MIPGEMGEADEETQRKEETEDKKRKQRDGMEET